MTLECRGVSRAFPGWPPTLDGADVSVANGTSAFLLGPSGSGKTTLLRCIAGLDTEYQGSISIDGLPVDALPPHRRGVGMIFQEPALFPHLDALGNVAFGLAYRGVPRRDRAAEALHWLELVGLADRAKLRVDALSGGQRQRVALARTLAARPRVVLLDEPFAGLDRELRDSLGPRVKALLAEQGVPALWVTHDRDEALRLGDAVHRLVDGRIVAGAP